MGHVNWMGGVSHFQSNPIARLRMAASSCFFGEPMFYHDSGARPSGARAQGLPAADAQALRKALGAVDPREWRSLSPSALLESAIDEALAFDPEATMLEAVRLRGEENLRAVPQVIMVRAANAPSCKGTGLVTRHAAGIIRRADEPAAQLAYQLSCYGKPIPNALKKAWKRALEGFDENRLAKYRMEARAVKTLDVVNLVRAKSPAVDMLMKGSLRLDGTTWEDVVSAGGGSRESWERALELLVQPRAHMALLRNLRNLHGHGLLSDNVTQALRDGVAQGRQLPFRYWSAWRACKEAGVAPVHLKALEDCLGLSMEALPTFKGRVASLCDNSGSAQGTATSSMGTVRVSTIANLSGVLAAKRADEGWVGLFGDRLDMSPVGPGGVFEHLEDMEKRAGAIGQGTENGIWLFFDEAIKKGLWWDHIFVYSDMQAGHGGLYGTDPSKYAKYAWGGASGGMYIDVGALIGRYREKVNPNVMVYLVQVAGYKDALVPEFYDRTFILGGWSDSVLRFADAMAREFDSAAATARASALADGVEAEAPLVSDGQGVAAGAGACHR